MAKKKKEKLPYSTRQNSVYVLKLSWQRDKIMLLQLLALMVLPVAVSTVWLFLPATVVAHITAGVGLQTLVLTLAVFTAALVALNTAQSYISNVTQLRRNMQNVQNGFDIRNKVIDTDYANIETQAFSDLRQKAQHNLYQGVFMLQGLQSLGVNVLGFVVYLVLLATLNPLVVLLTAATAVMGVAVRNRANRWRFKRDNQVAEFNKRIYYINHIGQQYGMGKDIRLFNMVTWIQSIFDKNIAAAYAFERKSETRQWFADAAGALGGFALSVIAYGYLIWQVLQGNIAVDTFVLLLAAVYGFSDWLTGILNEIANLANTSLHLSRVRELLAYPDSFKREEGETILPAKEYAISLENISLRYSGANENTLENVNLHINPGEKLAIVGLNGAGKTTLVKLLVGFYDPSEGRVLLNGKDIRDYNRLEYYKLFTAVFQDFNITPNTIAETVAQEVGDDVDRAKVTACLEMAGLSEKIDALPQGIDSLLLKEVHEEAVALSGGETQKMMLARALYKNAPVLVLDEPTAALDPIAESRLYERYNELSEGRTSVYISHRLASTRFCDRIILIDNKGIAEEGTHEQLMALDGKYAELFEIQSKYYKHS